MFFFGQNHHHTCSHITNGLDGNANAASARALVRGPRPGRAKDTQGFRPPGSIYAE